MNVQDKPDYLVFASDAQSGEIESFPNVARGWGITIEQTESKPPMEWMNDAFNRIDKNMLYLLQQGVPEWDSSVLYPVDAVIKYKGELYIALIENSDAIPSVNEGKWNKLVKEASTTQKGIVQLSSAIDSDSETIAATSKAVKAINDRVTPISELVRGDEVTGATFILSPDSRYRLLVKNDGHSGLWDISRKLWIWEIDEKGCLLKGGAIKGDFRLFPFRASELPDGWYSRNGDKYPITSEVGKALQSLSYNFKLDWGIVESSGYINLPTAFYSDGRGMFERPVNGMNRQVGSCQEDAIRNITGSCGMDGIAGATSTGFMWNLSGAFSVGGVRSKVAKYSPSNSGNVNEFLFDASRVVPTANENRPLNTGLTPAIYLGV